MKNKSTLVCMHVMPQEIEMFIQLIHNYKLSLKHLDDSDDVTLKISLNLNPELTDWDNTNVSKDEFISVFNDVTKDVPNLDKEIITDTSLWGTTQQKRESIKIDYFDQFIFVDSDIILHEHQLLYQLRASEKLEGKYIISPSIPKWWDNSWDYLVGEDLQDTPALVEETIEKVYNQKPSKLVMKQIPTIKFGCGMHTLYSKEFQQFIGIPDSLGGYGPEDTIGMMRAIAAIHAGHEIKQFVLDGIFITEDVHNREPSFKDKIFPITDKDLQARKGKELIREEVSNFMKTL